MSDIITELVKNSIDTTNGSSKEVKECLWIHSIAGGLVSLIPVIGIIITWGVIISMYIRLPRALGKSFKENWFLNLFGGIVLTIIVSIIIENWLDSFGEVTEGLGWFLRAFIVFAEIWASACVYLLIRNLFK